MPFKDKAARYAKWKRWAARNLDKVKARNRKNVKNYWTKHARPKQLSTFDRFENRRRIKELKILGVHMLIVGEVKRGFQVVTKLARSITGCIDCGNPKRLMILQNVTVKIPSIVLRFPFEPVNDRTNNDKRREIEANFKYKHCEHLQFDDLTVARGLAYDYRPQCYCDFKIKRRITLDSFRMDIAFCRDCWSRHAADNFNFDYCPNCMVKLLDSKVNFARLSEQRLHEEWLEGMCKHCGEFIQTVHEKIRNAAYREWLDVQRIVKALKRGLELANNPLPKDWSLEQDCEKFKIEKKALA